MVGFDFGTGSLSNARADEPATTKPDDSHATPKKDEGAKKNWKTMKGSWEAVVFGGDGDVTIKDDQINFGIGDPLTGVHWTGPVERENFEIELEARRVEGFDFFCGVTFPVGPKQASFIMGGWGGGVVGLSNINGVDASENETTYYRTFKNGQWYKIRVRVDPYQITTWIDDSESVEQPRKDREFDIRYEMELCLPIGLAAFQCESEIRNLRIRSLSPEEIAAAKQAAIDAENEDK